MAILSAGPESRGRGRDSIILTFQDAKISVMEYSDSLCGLYARYCCLTYFLLFITGLCFSVHVDVTKLI